MTWPLVALSSLVKINPKPAKPVDKTQPVVHLPMAAIANTGQILKQSQTTLADSNPRDVTFTRGDLLLAKTAALFAQGCVVSTHDLATPLGYGCNECHVIRPDGAQVDGQFLYYLLRSKRFIQLGQHQLQGAGSLKRLPTRFIGEYEVPIPFPDDCQKSLDEQRRVAAIFAKADEISTKRLDAIALVEQLLHRHFIDLFGDPSDNQSRAQQGILAELVEDICAGVTVKNDDKAGSYQLLRASHINEVGRFELTPLQSVAVAAGTVQKATVKNGDIIFNRLNTKTLVGRSAIVDFAQPMRPTIISASLLRISVNQRATPAYLWGYLNSAYGKAALSHLATGHVGASRVDIKALKNLPIAIAPIKLQQQFQQSYQQIQQRLRQMHQAQTDMMRFTASLVEQVYSGQW